MHLHSVHIPVVLQAENAQQEHGPPFSPALRSSFFQVLFWVYNLHASQKRA